MSDNTPTDDPRPFRWGWRGLADLLPLNPTALRGIFKSLRYRNFALYFGGQCVSLVGAWIQQVALGWLIYSITQSALMLSIAVFLAQIPMLFVTPFAGVVTDRFDKRHILIFTQSAQMALALVLAVLTLTGRINIELIFALSLVFGLLMSFDAPARQAFYSKLVPTEDLSNAIALNSTVINGARFVGPAVGGWLIAQTGEGWCFLLNSFTFLATIWALLLIRMPAFHPPQGVHSVLGDIHEGISYAKHTVPIRAILLLLLSVSFFGVPFLLLMPAFVGQLGGDSQMLGNLMSCVGIGSVTAALCLAARKRALGLGKMLTLASIVFGVAMILISFVKTADLAYWLCVPLGFGMIAVAASANTLLQTLVDDSKRGRVMSLFSMLFLGLPPVGSLLQGYLSGFVPLWGITLVCGIICVISGVAFEYYRPIVRKHARAIYAAKGIVMPEMANALNFSNRRPPV